MTIRADETYLATCPVCRRRRWAWVPIPAKKLIMRSHWDPEHVDECGGSREEVGTNHHPRVSRARKRPKLMFMARRRRWPSFDLGEHPDRPDWVDKTLKELEEEVRAFAQKEVDGRVRDRVE